MTFSKEMQAALLADGEKLRQLTGENHGPEFITDDMLPLYVSLRCPLCQWGWSEAYSPGDLVANVVISCPHCHGPVVMKDNCN